MRCVAQTPSRRRSGRVTTGVSANDKAKVRMDGLTPGKGGGDGEKKTSPSAVVMRDLSGLRMHPPLVRGGFLGATGNFVYQFGGQRTAAVKAQGVTFSGAVWKLSLVSLSWTQLKIRGAAPAPRAEFGGTISDGIIYVHGGVQQDGALLGDIWGLNTTSKSWFEIKPNRQLVPPIRRQGMAFSGGQLYHFGGYTANGLTSSAWALNITSGEWAALYQEDEPLNYALVGTADNSIQLAPVYAPQPRADAVVQALSFGVHLVIYGGYDVDEDQLSDLWVMSVPVRRWTRLRPLDSAGNQVLVDWPVATAVKADERILLLGQRRCLPRRGISARRACALTAPSAPRRRWRLWK